MNNHAIVRALIQLEWASRSLEATKLTGNTRMIERAWIYKEGIIDKLFNLI